MQHAIRWVDFPHSWVVLSYNQSTQIAPPNDDCKRGGVVRGVANWRPRKFWASHLRTMRSGWKAALASFLKIKSKILRRWNVLYAFLYQIKCFYNARCNTPKCVTSLRGPSPSYCTRTTQLFSKKCCSGGKPLAILCAIWLARDLNLRPPAP